jgi:hypothetical protein
VSRTRQAAGLGRQRLRVVIPPRLSAALAVTTVAALRSAAAAANVDVAWIEAPLDAGLSLISRRQADAGPGWLTARTDALPAPLDAMTLGDFEPGLWLPAAHPAARHGTVTIAEIAGLQVIHGPRRASPEPTTAGLTSCAPRTRVCLHRPAVPALTADDARLRRHRRTARRGLDRSRRHHRNPARRDPVPPPGGHRRHGSGQHHRPPADRDSSPGMHGDLPRPLQQILFDTADGVTPPASAPSPPVAPRPRAHVHPQARTAHLPRRQAQPGLPQLRLAPPGAAPGHPRR